MGLFVNFLFAYKCQNTQHHRRSWQRENTTDYWLVREKSHRLNLDVEFLKMSCFFISSLLFCCLKPPLKQNVSPCCDKQPHTDIMVSCHVTMTTSYIEGVLNCSWIRSTWYQKQVESIQVELSQYHAIERRLLPSSEDENVCLYYIKSI